jgi:class 3 adenylate cyclase
MPESVVNCKYVFIDIVGYSKNRSVEAQIDIIGELNNIVKQAISSMNIPKKKNILIPTGDGMCIALLKHELYDIHVVLALKILELLNEYNKNAKDDMHSFKIRIGINENDDNIIYDINNRRNIAGSGINYAQRVMNLSDANMIIVGTSVFEKLSKRDKYLESFKEYQSIIKHNETIKVYQFNHNCLPEKDISYRRFP